MAKIDKPKIRLLVLDLDNTLWDWLEMAVPAIYAQAQATSYACGVSLEYILNDMRNFHILMRNSDTVGRHFYLDTTVKIWPEWEVRCMALKGAWEAYVETEQSNTVLYPNVRNTLELIHLSGCKIVGYTDSYYKDAKARMEVAGILRYFDALVARDDGSYIDFTAPRGKLISEKNLKPNPMLLHKIVLENDTPLRNSLMVGNSSRKDIGPALNIGIWTAQAQYGNILNPATLRKYLKIGHVTKEMFDKESQLNTQFWPDLVMNRFDNLLEFFSFGAK